MIPVHSPKISVILIKTVNLINVPNSSGVNAKNAIIDLTPYLNEGSSVTAHKSVNSPNNGFTIRLGDQLIRNYGTSIYTAVEPMDVILIRMTGKYDPVKKTHEPQLVIRGVVTDTSQSESIGEGGKPSRIVTITGGDYGCFLRMFRINFLHGTGTAGLLAGIAKTYMETMFGIPFLTLPAGTFVAALTTRAINDFIGKIDNPALPSFLVNLEGADPDDYVFPQGIQANPDGTMWSHLQKHGNLGPFYELLIDDDEDKIAPTLRYRKPPYKNLAGELISDATGIVESFRVSPQEITAIQRSRSEHDVANFYMVHSGPGEYLSAIDTTRNMLTEHSSQMKTTDYQNSLESLYGFRMMDVTTEHGSLLTQSIPGQKKAEFEKGSTDHTEYILKQIKYLQDCNVDNVVFESGSINCKGSPEYKPGRYCEIDFGNGNKSSCYVTSVVHNFVPFRGYTCTLQFIRGTGFVNFTLAQSGYFYGKGVY